MPLMRDEHTIEEGELAKQGRGPEKLFSRRIKNLKQKLIYFLSDPSFSDKELEMLFDYLKADNIEEMTSTVKKIRKIIAHSSYNRNSYSDHYNSIEENRSIEVERLLIEDANLTKLEAMNLLASRFNIALNPNPNLSFNKWIERLGEKVGWSELLHIAHLIRNDRVHGKPDNPWPLEQND